MTDEAATPEDETPEAASEEKADLGGGEGGADNPAHSTQQAESQNVREVTDTADDSSETPDSADPADPVSTKGSDADATTPDPSDAAATAAEPAAPSEPEPAVPGREAEETAVDSSTSADPAATPEPSVNSETAEPAAPSEPEPAAPGREAEEAAAVDKKKPAVPGADLEPIALEADQNLSAEERARLEAEAEEEQARREAELAAEKAEEEVPVREPAKLDEKARFRATGKRKSAIARVILKSGSGEVTVNGKPLETYFPRSLHQTMVRQPLAATGYAGSIEVQVRVHGGGISGQASAVRHGIARALTEIDAELRGDLKRRGFLTRDARVKERHKAGFKKARKRPQFSKR